MKKQSPLLACVLVAFVLSACGNDEAAAKAAVQTGEQAIQAVSDEAGRYVPGKLTQAWGDLTAARGMLSAGRYREAHEAGKALSRKAEDLAAATAAKKDELTKAWHKLSAPIPQTIASLTARIEELGGAKKLPGVLDAEMLTAARENVAGMALAWDEASSAYAAGDLPTAVTKASSLSLKGEELKAFLGVPAGAPAEGARAEAPAR